jgi:hypothetical protein
MSLRLERGDFLQQYFRVHHDPIGDHAELVWMKRTRRDKMKNGFFPVYHERMAGIVAALEANDDIGVLCEEVDDFSFTFVSPLCSYDRDVRHLLGVRQQARGNS